jgi:general stress protein 13
MFSGEGSMNKLSIGDIIECKVTGISNYGIFVLTSDNYTGLIHISEISNYFVKNVSDYASLGEEIICEVIDIDEENKRLKLSIKNINYKLTHKFGKIRDTKDGFKELQKKLPIWIREKLGEIEEKEK